MNKYLIYDEAGDLMRIVGRQEEARHLVSNHDGWTFKRVRTPKLIIDLSQFQEALI